MGIKNSIRVKKKNKMKLSFALLAVAAADDKKVPPRHPLQRLNRLTEFSHEILDDWFSFVPSKAAWKRKFTRNAERMKTNFPTVVPRRENADLTMSSTDTTVKTHPKVSNKLLLATASGLSVTSPNALVKNKTNTRLTV